MAAIDIGQRRLFTQRIEGKRFVTPEAVVGFMGAMQAQDYGHALWAVGVRTGAAAVDVERAIDNALIVRTWPMRGTIHFVPAEDARWMLQLSAPRLLGRDGRRLAQLGLDVPTVERCQRHFHDALHGGKRLSRPDMLALLERAGIPMTGQRGYHVLWYASQSGLICPGPMATKATSAAKEQTFVLLDEWVPKPRTLPREAAIAELARRYATSHGPATAHDFAWWAGLTLTEARQGLEASRPAIVKSTIGDREHWLCEDVPAIAAGHDDAVHLLPGFDEFILGYTNRDAVLAAKFVQRIIPGGNGVFMSTIVAGGQVIGTWRRTVTRKGVDVALVPFKRTPGLRDRAQPAAERYAAFVGLPLASLSLDRAA